MGWIAFFLGEKQYQQISVGDGTGVGRARSLMEFNEKCPDFPDSGPSSRRHASVESESCDLVPVPASGIQSEECDGVQESGGAGTRSCASSRPARWQRGGQRVQRRKRAAAVAEIRTGGSWTSTPLASMSQQAPDHVHNSARSATTRPVKSFKQCHKIRQEQSPDGRLPPSLTCSENRLETLARRVEGLLRKRLEVIRSQARDFKECARRVRWTWHFAKNRLRLRGFVLDTTFGPRCDVAKPLVSHQNSTRRLRWKMSIANLLHRASRPWILEDPCDSWLWNVPKIEALAAQSRTAWTPSDHCIFGSQYRKRTLLLVW